MVSELQNKDCIPLLNCDSQIAIHLAKNPAHHERSKHINVRHHFVRDLMAKGDLKLVKVSIDEYPADMLNKTLPSMKFNYLLNLLSIEPS